MFGVSWKAALSICLTATVIKKSYFQLRERERERENYRGINNDEWLQKGRNGIYNHVQRQPRSSTRCYSGRKGSLVTPLCV